MYAFRSRLLPLSAVLSLFVLSPEAGKGNGPEQANPQQNPTNSQDRQSLLHIARTGEMNSAYQAGADLALVSTPSECVSYCSFLPLNSPGWMAIFEHLLSQRDPVSVQYVVATVPKASCFVRAYAYEVWGQHGRPELLAVAQRDLSCKTKVGFANSFSPDSVGVIARRYLEKMKNGKRIP